MKAMPVPDGRVDLAAAEKQSRKVLHKQDKLLLQGFSLLLNLAEDIHVEKKMCKRGIVRLLGTYGGGLGVVMKPASQR